LSTRAALQCSLIGAQTRASIDRQHAFDFGMRPWNHVNADQLADSSRRSSACVCRRLYRADVAADEDRHVTSANVLFAQQLYIRCLDHCIGGLNCTHESFGLNHSECFQGHLLYPHFVIVEIKSDYYPVTIWPQPITADDKKQETPIYICPLVLPEWKTIV
jgi:hypothetical protein